MKPPKPQILNLSPPCHVPQVEKPPWLAAWDRQIRMLVRLQHGAGEVAASSSGLEAAFTEAAKEEEGEEMGAVELEGVSRGAGYRCTPCKPHYHSMTAY